MRASIRDAIGRFIERDGTTHVRAFAYQSVFVVVSGFIGLVGLAGVLDWPELRATVQEQATSIAPGPASRLLQEAAQRGASGSTSAAVIGLAAALTAGTLAMAQLQRSANRLCDVTDDGPALRRYLLAFVLAGTAGVLLVVGGLVLGAGRSIATGVGLDASAAMAWSIARWPIGLATAGAGILVLYRVLTPGKPSGRDVFAGTLVALSLWAVFTTFLGVYLSLSSQPSRTYGPLLAVIALLLWSALTSLALHLGIAVIAARTRGPAERTVRVPESAQVSRRVF